ncbi:MAG: glycosyltransferase [Betaproteobacteria bacterium]|nr:glycosyltransferase [Betaproteobacteria bacterium]
MARSHEVTICCVKMLGDLAASVDPRIHVVCLDKGEGNDLRLPFRLSRLLRERNIDVMHAHNWGVYLEAALAGVLARTPVCIQTVHGPYMDYAPGWSSQLKRRVRHTLERMLAPLFAKIVTVSDSVQTYIREEIGIPGSRLATIHNGIQVDETAHAPKTAAKLSALPSAD